MKVHNPCGIGTISLQTCKSMRYALTTYDDKVQSSINGSSWADEYTIPTPPTELVWTAWSYQATITAGSTWICIYGGTNNLNNYTEIGDASLYLNDVPTVALCPERQLGEADRAVLVEGDGNLYMMSMAGVPHTRSRTQGLSLGLPVTAFICVFVYLATGTGCTTQSLRLRLYTTASDYYEETWNYTEAASSTAIHIEEVKVSAMTVVGSPDLTSIAEVELYGSSNGPCAWYIDDLRLVDADPADGNSPNDTGSLWDFETGTWHVYEQGSVAKSLGQIDVSAGVEQIALVHTDYGADVRVSCACRAKRDDGQVGIVFRCTDAASGSEDFYAFLMDTGADEVLLKQYLAGAISDVAAPVAFTSEVDGDYYLGIVLQGTNIQCFASASRTNLWNVANRMFNETDPTHAAGQCGVMSIGTLGRFSGWDVETIGDLHLPDDQLSVTVYGLYQTVYPFHE